MLNTLEESFDFIITTPLGRQSASSYNFPKSLSRQANSATRIRNQFLWLQNHSLNNTREDELADWCRPRKWWRLDWLVCPSYKERLVGDLWETVEAKKMGAGKAGRAFHTWLEPLRRAGASQAPFAKNVCPSERGGPTESRSSCSPLFILSLSHFLSKLA